MGLTIEDKLAICQQTIADLEKENKELKEENQKYKAFVATFSEDGQKQVFDYLDILKGATDDTTKAREEYVEEMKKNNEAMKKSRREIDKLITKMKFKTMFM